MPPLVLFPPLQFTVALPAVVNVPSHPLDDQRVHMVPESEQQVDAGSAGHCW